MGREYEPWAAEKRDCFGWSRGAAFVPHMLPPELFDSLPEITYAGVLSSYPTREAALAALDAARAKAGGGDVRAELLAALRETRDHLYVLAQTYGESHYTRRILDEADAAIARAKEAES